jgi:hypothetical protein
MACSTLSQPLLEKVLFARNEKSREPVRTGFYFSAK